MTSATNPNSLVPTQSSTPSKSEQVAEAYSRFVNLVQNNEERRLHMPSKISKKDVQ